jgi:hypothetical protein
MPILRSEARLDTSWIPQEILILKKENEIFLIINEI